MSYCGERLWRDLQGGLSGVQPNKSFCRHCGSGRNESNVSLSVEIRNQRMRKASVRSWDWGGIHVERQKPKAVAFNVEMPRLWLSS